MLGREIFTSPHVRSIFQDPGGVMLIPRVQGIPEWSQPLGFVTSQNKSCASSQLDVYKIKDNGTNLGGAKRLMEPESVIKLDVLGDEGR